MNKPKAPKDKTSEEFVAHIESVLETTMRLSQTTEDEKSLTRAIIRVMREELEKPAPNPFTPDQIAWMREEQRSGFKYAAMDKSGDIYLFNSVYGKSKERGIWAGSIFRKTHDNFLCNILSWDDSEPLCFADYAPLEGADK